MVGLDLRRGRRDVGCGRFDHIRIQRSLRQEVDVPETRGLGFEDGDELAANDTPLLLRVGDAAQRVEETRCRVDIANVHVEVAVHHGQDPLGLLLAKQPVVDEHAGQLVADRAVDQRRRNRGVHATRQRADHPSSADPGADAVDRVSDEGTRRPRRVAVAHAIQEIPQDLAAAWGVDDLGMELDAEDAVAVGEGGHR